MDARWRITLFGGLRAEQGGRVITRFRTQKTASLLAYLAFYGERAHRRETLIELFWAEARPEAGRNNLSKAVSSLRRQLEPPGVPTGAVLMADRYTLRLNPAAATTDVAEFEAHLRSGARSDNDGEKARHLTTAVELYRGALLDGLFEEWIDAERQRLADAYLNALRQLTRLLGQAKEFDRAIDYARRAVNADPLQERSHRTLMRLYAAVGRPAAALEHFVELERILKADLGVAPSATTRTLAREIREQLAVDSYQLTPKSAIWDVDSKPSTVNRQPLTIEHQPSASNLPLQFTRFFGREEEIARLRTMLLTGDTRLVTLTGLGGSGKTRLAIEVAGQLREDFSGGVWFVPLTDVTDPRLIVATVRDTLRLSRSAEDEPLEQVVNALNRSLLVLDNFEQLAAGGALVVLTLLKRVPSLKLLVTSRRRLDVAGEREFIVSPLPLPEHPNTRTPEHLMSFPSVQLFVDRAQAKSPDFQLTPQGGTAMAGESAGKGFMGS